jgi:hypothetical protein
MPLYLENDWLLKEGLAVIVMTGGRIGRVEVVAFDWGPMDWV